MSSIAAGQKRSGSSARSDERGVVVEAELRASRIAFVRSRAPRRRQITSTRQA
jgi:hypothetical protein